MDRWIDKICPNAFKLLKKSKYNASVCIVDLAEISKFEVTCMYED